MPAYTQRLKGRLFNILWNSSNRFELYWNIVFSLGDIQHDPMQFRAQVILMDRAKENDREHILYLVHKLHELCDHGRFDILNRLEEEISKRENPNQ